MDLKLLSSDMPEDLTNNLKAIEAFELNLY